MKRYIIYIIGVIGLLTACDVETSDNGDLDGFWVLASLEENGIRNDMRNSGITWGFQGELLELRDVRKEYQTFLMSFEHKSQTLRLYAPFFLDRNSGDIPLDNSNYLLPYGIRHLEEHFHIVRLNSDEMMLEADERKLEFRKY
jgi:hypothetical protein